MSTSSTTAPPASRRRALHLAALAAALVATVPYLALKVMWLSGSTVGLTGGSDVGMHSTRFVVGNGVTIVLMLVAAAFVVALTRPSADHVPPGVVFVLGAGATGLLAPILLGLPVGLAVQAVVTGEVSAAHDSGLEQWVFGVVYSGFGLLALAMGVLVVAHVLRRWGHLLSDPPARPTPPAVLAGAVGLLPFAAAMTYWGLAGPGSSGPQGMVLPAQRTVLVVTGLLAAAAFAVPLLSGAAGRWPRLAWLTAWTGCCVAALQGPTLLLLAQGGEVEPVVAGLALVATPGAGAYGLHLMRRRLG